MPPSHVHSVAALSQPHSVSKAGTPRQGDFGGPCAAVKPRAVKAGQAGGRCARFRAQRLHPSANQAPGPWHCGMQQRSSVAWPTQGVAGRRRPWRPRRRPWRPWRPWRNSAARRCERPFIAWAGAFRLPRHSDGPLDPLGLLTHSSTPRRLQLGPQQRNQITPRCKAPSSCAPL